MNVNRIVELETRSALAAVQDFLASLLTRRSVDALFAPIVAPDGGIGAMLVSDPLALKQANPFVPLMLASAAKSVAEASLQADERHIGAVLRPCEIRALIEMSKRGRARLERLTVIGIDCLGTFELAEFERQLALAGGLQGVTARCMQVAETGELACLTRTACQICERPAPRGADVTLGFIGVDATREVLVIAADESTDRRLGLPELTSREAGEPEVAKREATLTAIVQRHKQAAEREVARLGSQFGGLGGLLALLASCAECRACLVACPLYDGEIDDASQSVLGQMGAVARWLVSCAGCGMCEEACPHGVPLAVMARALSRPIRDRMHYTPGMSVTDKLPWIS